MSNELYAHTIVAMPFTLAIKTDEEKNYQIELGTHAESNEREYWLMSREEAHILYEILGEFLHDTKAYNNEDIL